MHKLSMMVEVFKTDVSCPAQAHKVIRELMLLYPEYQMNFDLEDCDKIFRVEHQHVETKKLISELQAQKIQIELLPD